MKINVGCGGRRIAGYTGVDVVDRSGAVDILAPADKIPLPDESCDEVLAVHVIEHVYEWEASDLLREWYRLLKPDGLLVLELPDIVKCARNIVDGVKGKHPDQLGLWGVFGDNRLRDPWMMHKWGWSFATLAPRVRGVGFVNVVEKDTAFHAAGYKVRDFRLEARKPS